ncbi:MAG: transcriptional regulator [Microbacterium sp.]|nr:transcriptional regulator [Microbacterium sp.]
MADGSPAKVSRVSDAEEGQAGSGDFVQSLARGLEVIRTFDAEHPALTLSDVARRADLTRAAARRFLRTLETLGYVRADGRFFSLTPRVLELGFSYLSALSLPALAQPYLERLSREVDESVSSAVLDGADIVYVARVPTRRIMSVGITIGTRFPAYATSMGRVLLAAQPEGRAREIVAASHPEPLTSRTRTDVEAILEELASVRAQGWALVDGELEEGLRSLAAPIRDREGTVVAALNISATARGDGDAWREQCLPALLAAAADIDADLRLI